MLVPKKLNFNTVYFLIPFSTMKASLCRSGNTTRNICHATDGLTLPDFPVTDLSIPAYLIALHRGNRGRIRIDNHAWWITSVSTVPNSFQ